MKLWLLWLLLLVVSTSIFSKPFYGELIY